MRSLRAKSFALVAVAVFGFQSTAYAARFIDTSGSWSERYVNFLSDKGVIPAESDGKFKPDEPVTRAVLAAWLVKVLGIDNQPVPSVSSFPDVKTTDWFFKPVEIIRQNNYISGYADGFRPNQFIQRAEVMTIIARTLNTPTPDAAKITSELAKFKDGVDVPEWAKTGVAQAAAANIPMNSDSSSINPTGIATRGDTAAMLAKLDEFIGKKSIARASTPVADPPRYQEQPPQQGYQQPGQGGYPPPGYGQAPPSFQGQVSAQGKYQQPPGGYSQHYPGADGGGYQPPQQGYPPPQQGYPPPQYGAPGQGAYAPNGGYQQPPPNYLQGNVAVVAAGTHFRANLRTTLDSGSTQAGDEVYATLSEPILSNGTEVVPAGSRLVGTVTNVVSAARFRAGANGKIDIRFNTIETPDGRRFPLSASVDGGQIRLSGGTTGGRIGKGLMTTGIGAGSGAVLGTALGAIVGPMSGGTAGRGVAMGAIFGTAIGAGVGGVGAVVRKGSEVKLTSGTSLPVQLDQSLQISGIASGYQQGQGGGGQYGGGYPPPQQGGYYPQQ